MRKGFSFISLLLFGLFVISATNSGNFLMASDGPRFEYQKEENRIDLGKIYIDELEEINLEIEFKNTGTEPLIVSHVRACCGTRVIDWTKEPISPGESGTIEVHFRLAPRPHNVNRTVLAMSNDPDGQKVLRIRGSVEER